jgi:type IV pilus assembly protein PilC
MTLKNKKHKKSSSYYFSSKFSVKNQTFFAKRLSFLIKAGVSMLESVHIIRNQTKSKSEIKIFDKLLIDVSNGQSLATALDGQSGTFNNFSINIIRAGESSGTLVDNLNYLAEELKKKETLRKKIMSAMYYPAIITIATLGITGALVAYIFPKILPIFQSLNAELPFSTRALIYMSDTIRHSGVYILITILLFALCFYLLLKHVPKFRFICHGLLLRLPFSGYIAKNYNISNAARTLGLLLREGSPLNEAILITSETTDNMRYKKAFNDIARGVMEGKKVSEVMERHSHLHFLFPDLLRQMVATGERSGNLSNTLIYLSEFYESEFDDLTKNLSSSIEPVLMIIMGIMVGFVAISVITPIYEITNSIKR